MRKGPQNLSYDYKHKKNGVKIQVLVNADGIAVHCDIDTNSSIHDKCIFDSVIILIETKNIIKIMNCVCVCAYH